MSQVILVASGKGGTGKTSLTAAIAACLAALGHRTLCIDMDIGMRNLDLSLAMNDVALMDFSDVLARRTSLKRAVTAHPRIEHLYLLNAPLRFEPNAETAARFAAMIALAREEFSFIFLDAPAGLGDGFALAQQEADRGLVVSTSDVNALRDANRCVMQLPHIQTLHLIMNRVSPKLLRQQHTNIDQAMDEAGLPLLGIVPEDANITLASAAGTPLVLYSRTGASLACLNIARRLLGERVPLKKRF